MEETRVDGGGSFVRAVPLAIAVWSTGWVAGCGDPPELHGEACGGVSRDVAYAREPITEGSERSLIGLSEMEMSAVVLVAITDAGASGTCSGSLVSADRVLTARHCVAELKQPKLEVSFGPNQAAPLFRSPAGVLLESEEADLALLDLERAVPPDVAKPLRIATELDGSPSIGVIAGFGVTAELEIGQRRFAVVDVSANDRTTLVTSAAPHSGACIGDSGGPLLWRDSRGRPAVFGVLSYGSGSCRGDDFYTRAGLFRDFVRDVPEVAAERRSACADLGSRGLCVTSTLSVWCDADELATEHCSGSEACGFDVALDGYRCVDPTSDPCQGYHQLGACDGGFAKRCEGGALVTERCCAATCARDPSNGQASCG